MIKPIMAGLGLDSLGDLSDLLNQPVMDGKTNGPLQLSLDLIDEDPNQPRHADNPGFSKESLAELAETIEDRGVKSPISVREHPKVEGRYIINHGARRFRASRIAGKDSIPAFIDNDYSEADQVIENLQRNELTKGKKKSEIAREIGKSPAFVTQHVVLLDLPDPIATAFSTGRANDVTVINELVKDYKKNPEQVRLWLADESQELTRGSVKLLHEFLEDKRIQDAGEVNDSNTVDALPGKTDAETGESEQDQTSSDAKKIVKLDDPEKLKKAIIHVNHDGRLARLILTRRPPADGWAWLKYEDDGHEFEAELTTVQLVALLEG